MFMPLLIRNVYYTFTFTLDLWENIGDNKLMSQAFPILELKMSQIGVC